MSPQKAATSIVGLRKKPTYEQLINYILTDQDIIRYPDRYAKQLRESPFLTQLDGEGMGDMEAQQEKQFQETYHENVIRQVASTSNKSVSQIKAEIQHNNTSSDTPAPDVKMKPAGGRQRDKPDITMTASAGNQTDNAETVDAGTDYGPPRPPPSSGRLPAAVATGILPPEHHTVHLNNDRRDPPPPPPEAQRITVSTSDSRADVPQPSTFVPVRRGRPTNLPYEKASGSGNNPQPPPPPGASSTQ